ncbi:hypothetical protein [Streptomyces tremellae]|uniref:Uncharacterized protein n=1 Tax=Streptomyces tremellae TaxID=1124239 RepID=A0ABP7EEH6_9ACTN
MDEPEEESPRQRMSGVQRYSLLLKSVVAFTAFATLALQLAK